MKKAVVLSLNNDKIELIKEGEITAFIKHHQPKVEEPFICFVHSKEDKTLVCAFLVSMQKYSPISSGFAAVDKCRFELICTHYAGLKLEEIYQYLRDGAFIWNIKANSVRFFAPISVKELHFNNDEWGYMLTVNDQVVSLSPHMTYEEWTIYKGSNGKYYVHDPKKYGDELMEVYIYQERDNHYDWNLFQQKTSVSFGGDYDGETDDKRYLVSFRIKGD